MIQNHEASALIRVFTSPTAVKCKLFCVGLLCAMLMYGYSHVRERNEAGTSLILSKFDLIKYIEERRLIISPFTKTAIAYNGVDQRLGTELARLKTGGQIFDTRKRNDFSLYYEKETGTEFVINPDERVLMCTLERLTLPNDIVGFVGLRSTYSRLGLHLALVDN